MTSLSPALAIAPFMEGEAGNGSSSRELLHILQLKYRKND
jgi:hypothetical protein